MRITEIDLEIEDIEWYGIDENGRVGRFTSGGSRMIPEFICESRERLETVCDFFENFNSYITEEVTFSEEVSKYPRKEYIQECKKISQKGLYCFDIFDEQDTIGRYMLMCKSGNELLISELPEIIQTFYRNIKCIMQILIAVR